MKALSRLAGGLTAGRTAIAAVALAALLFASSAQASKEYEPNDSRDAAYGPLAGGTDYTASFETDNDVDWYVFYVKTYSQMDFSATHIQEVPKCYEATVITLLDKDGKEFNSFPAGHVNEVDHLPLTLNPGRYYLAMEGCTGDRYRFRIDPATAITPSRECGEAIVAKEAIGPELAKTNRMLAKRTEVLEGETQELEEAEKTLHRAARKYRRIVRKQRKSQPYKLALLKKYAHLKVLARHKVSAAKFEQARAMKPVAKLQATASQQQQAIAADESQMATYC